MAFWSNKDANPARKYRFKLGPAGSVWWYANSATLPSFEINTGEYILGNHKFKYPGVVSWNPVTISFVDIGESVNKLKANLIAQGFSLDPSGNDGIKKYRTNAARNQLIRQKGKAEETKAVADYEASQSEEDVIKWGDENSKEITSIPADNTVQGTGESNQKKAKNKQATAVREAVREKVNNQLAQPADGNDFVIEQLNDEGKRLRMWTLKNSFISTVNYGELDYSSDDLVSVEIVVTYDYAEESN